MAEDQEGQASARLGHLVAVWRRDAGLSQASLAEALGTQQASISKLENGSSRISVLQMLAILDVCGLKLQAVASDIEEAAQYKGRPLWERINE